MELQLRNLVILKLTAMPSKYFFSIKPQSHGKPNTAQLDRSKITNAIFCHKKFNTCGETNIKFSMSGLQNVILLKQLLFFLVPFTNVIVAIHVHIKLL